MRRLALLSCAFMICAVTGWQNASAQLPKIKLPKTGQPKTQPTPVAQPTTTANDSQPTQPESRNAATTTTTAANSATQDQPTINKDSVQVLASTNGGYGGSYDTWSGVPPLWF